MTYQDQKTQLRIGDQSYPVTSSPGRRLSEVLREELGFKSVKVGCDAGDCGACTVLVEGAQVCACLMPLAQVSGRRVDTLETATPDLKSKLAAAMHAKGAAQCGICTPGVMMAALELLLVNPTPEEADVETALGGVLCRCTGYRKIVEAIMSVGAANETALPEAGKAVGAAVPRLDGWAKVEGREVFGADLVPEGCLSVRAVRSPHFHARFELGDVNTWMLAQPRLVAVITAADIKGENSFGVIPALADQPALAEGKTRFLGEAIALVVGPADVVEALDLESFPVDWTKEPYELTAVNSAKPGAVQLHANRSENTLIAGRVVCGDAEAALAGAAHVVSGDFETSYVEHAYIEPEAGVAWMDGETVVIQACTQAPVMDQEETAKVLGLPKSLVRIIPAAAGGGFGAKLDLSVQPLLGLAVLKTGRPCRMVWSRKESMLASTKRHPGHMTARIGADAAGNVVGMAFHGDFNTGAYASWGPTVAVRVPVHASGPYRTPNYRATSRAIHTHGPTSGAFRGFGVPQAAIAQEMLYDQLAEACGLDRLTFRQKNAMRDGDTSTCGQELESIGLLECLDALEPHWERALSEAKAFNASANGPIRRGVGVASCWYGCGNTSLPNPSTIRLGISAAGRLFLHQGATDIGQGANTVIAQITADALGVALDDLTLIGPDTALTPDCGKTSASRQTYVTGKAAELAGRALRQTILRQTNLSESAVITLGQGAVHVQDNGAEARIDLSTLTPNAQGYVLSAEETYDPPTEALDADGQGRPYAVYGYGAQVAEVAVDITLGTVKVLHMTAAHDLGRTINPLLAEGQIEGGIAQGLGLALMEEFIPGRTENLHDYLIPTIGDMPPVTSILIEKPDPEGPMGAKGLGEHVLIPTAPAILNAIRHASGAEIRKVPALPHRVLEAIRKL